MKFQPILQNFKDRNDYQLVDLSKSTLEKLNINPQNHQLLSEYLAQIKDSKNAKVLFGGYIEKRSLYNKKSLFQENNIQRNIHLGVDFWADAYEGILCPYEGIVHSFADNKGKGNYGPTIILQHNSKNGLLFSLYGHLTRDSIQNLKKGQWIAQGESFCQIGSAEVNGGYAPHLHFQLIKDLEGQSGDYAGVCDKDTLAFYKKNTMSPVEFLGL